MDPILEFLRNPPAAWVGLAGTIVGAVIAGVAGWLNAKSSVEGQRKVAEDAARRQHRLRQVSGFLELANRAIVLYNGTAQAIEEGRPGEIEAIRRWSFVRDLQANHAYLGAAESFREAGEKFVEVAEGFQREVNALEQTGKIGEYPTVWDRYRPEIKLAMRRLEAAAEEYTFGKP